MAWLTSHAAKRKHLDIWTYDRLRDQVLSSKMNTINFLIEQGVLKSNHLCPKCGVAMILSSCKDFMEDVCFRCQKRHVDKSSGGTQMVTDV